MKLSRVLALVVLVAIAIFAWQGGIYSTGDYLALQQAERTAKARIRSLTREVDSLKRFRKLLETDPVTQEMVAREQRGMIRPGELSFIIERGGADSADATKTGR